MNENEINKSEIIDSYHQYLIDKKIYKEWDKKSINEINEIFEKEIANNVLADLKNTNSSNRNLLSNYFDILIDFLQHDLAFSFSKPQNKYKIFAETLIDLSQGKPESWIGHHSPIQISYLQSAYKKYKEVKWLNCPKLDHLFLKNFIYDEYSNAYFMVLYNYHKTTASVGNAMEEVITQGTHWKMTIYRFITKPIGFFLNWILTPLLAFYLFTFSNKITNIIAIVLLGLFVFSILYRLIYFPKNFSVNKEINKNANEKLSIFMQSFNIANEEMYNPTQLKKVMTNNETEFALFQSNEVYILIDELIKNNPTSS